MMEIETKNKKVIEDVKKEVVAFVKEESAKRDKGFHKEWIEHLNAVAKNSLKLAERLNADKEIVFLAAWLHDIGNIVNHRKSDHHITGAKITEEKLKEIGYPEEEVQKVKHCVYSHRASKNIPRESVEAQILADADSMAHFEEHDLLVKAERILGNEQDEMKAKRKVKEKLIRSWNRLSEEGKELATEEYPEIMKEIEIK